jgi:hypothetical protein
MGKLSKRDVDGLLGPADRPHRAAGQSLPIRICKVFSGKAKIVEIRVTARQVQQ